MKGGVADIQERLPVLWTSRLRGGFRSSLQTGCNSEGIAQYKLREQVGMGDPRMKFEEPNRASARVARRTAKEFLRRSVEGKRPLFDMLAQLVPGLEAVL